MAEVKASDICVWNGYSWVSVKSGKVGFYNGSGFVFDCGKIRVCGGNGNFYYVAALLVDGLEGSDNRLIIGYDFTDLVITISASSNWSATKNVFWISISQSSGNAGNHQVTLSIEPNPHAYNDRFGVVTFTCGNEVFTLNITQTGSEDVKSPV